MKEERTKEFNSIAGTLLSSYNPPHSIVTNLMDLYRMPFIVRSTYLGPTHYTQRIYQIAERRRVLGRYISFAHKS